MICIDSLFNQMDKYLQKIDSYRDMLDPIMNGIRNDVRLGEYIDTDDIQRALLETGDTLEGDIEDCLSQLNLFSRQCFNLPFMDILNEAYGLADEIYNALRNLLGALNMLTCSFQIDGLAKLLRGLGLGSLFRLMDKILDCLILLGAPLERVDYIIDTMNGFMDDYDVGFDGNFNLDNFLDKSLVGIESIIADSIKANIQSIITGVAQITDRIKALLAPFMSLAIKVPSILY